MSESEEAPAERSCAECDRSLGSQSALVAHFSSSDPDDDWSVSLAFCDQDHASDFLIDQDLRDLDGADRAPGFLERHVPERVLDALFGALISTFLFANFALWALGIFTLIKAIWG